MAGRASVLAPFRLRLGRCRHAGEALCPVATAIALGLKGSADEHLGGILVRSQ